MNLRYSAPLILSLMGMGVSIYLTAYHYLQIPLACSSTGIINCETVLNSGYAYLLGTPIAVFGILFFAVELVLLHANHRRREDISVIYNAVGIGSVIYFIYLEKIIGSICLYCTLVHVIVIALFILSLHEISKRK